MSRCAPPAMDQAPAAAFPLLILASVGWVINVVIILPRFLGRLLAFLANRTARGSFHVSIPILHIYPLAGRAVAHSVRYTIPDGTIAVEQLVLQCRWWRKQRPLQFGELLTVDDPNTLDPVAHEQQQLERENAAFFFRRQWYRLRRWWRRAAVTTDMNNSAEPPPLISVICVGLRARIVNVEKNYTHLNLVLELAKAAKRRSSRSKDPIRTHSVQPSDGGGIDSRRSSAADMKDSSAISVELSESSLRSVDGKPFWQQVLEFASLRITDGAFYLCDMGQSPLVRLSVNSAKLRYRYGAPACPADECRKRIRMRVSGLKVSVSTQQAISKIVGGLDEFSTERNAGGMCSSSVDPHEDNTDDMLRRILSLGHKGIAEPLWAAAAKKGRSMTSGSGRSSRGPKRIISKLSTSQFATKGAARNARRTKPLSVTDVLISTTAVIDYIFDEPGPDLGARDITPETVMPDLIAVPEAAQENLSDLPPPLCRVSVLLRGCYFSYDVSAIANVERVMARLQPSFYDLIPFAKKMQNHNKMRVPTGVQIEIEATPDAKDPEREGEEKKENPLITFPFHPKSSTWKTLSELKVRRESGSNTEGNCSPDGTESEILPKSKISICASSVSLQTEVPYELGAPQKSSLLLSDVDIRTQGIVSMPLGRGKRVRVTRVIQSPVVWNEEHSISAEVDVVDSELFYLPDTIRVLNDMTTAVETFGNRPTNVRYFVPYRETTRIRAKEGYSVVLSCSDDNAWKDIHEGIADGYGNFKISGQRCELVLSPSFPTEFYPDATVLSWSLTLPNARGSILLEIPFAHEGEARQSEADHPPPAKSRAPSFAQRVRNQLETLTNFSHQVPATIHRDRRRQLERTILQTGQVCKLSGKLVENEERRCLNSGLHAFLDAVNRSDMHIRISAATLDINPHHMTHFLNLSRNYAGGGLHTISVDERNQLNLRRKAFSRTILEENRLPNLYECLSLGLSAGSILATEDTDLGVDDVISLSLQIDSLLVRFHNLPHALSPIAVHSQDSFSIECDKFLGSFHSNRLGHDLSCSPCPKRNVAFLYGGLLPSKCDSRNQIDKNVRKLALPRASIENLSIKKRALGSQGWGPYFSLLSIEIETVAGSVLDTTALSIARVAASCTPDSLHDDEMAVSALLCVENIDVCVKRADLLILIPSSSMAERRSGRMNRLLRGDRDGKLDRNNSFSEMPTFLNGLIHVRLLRGLRFHMSNFAKDSMASRSRLFVPDITTDVLMALGKKLIPWVDEATIRAQVMHAQGLQRVVAQGKGSKDGLLFFAANLREATADIKIGFQPSIWAPGVIGLQRKNIGLQSERARKRMLQWCNTDTGDLKRNTSPPHSLRALEEKWWVFLGNGHRSRAIEQHLSEEVGDSRVEVLSVSMVSSPTILLTPDVFDVMKDIITRSVETLENATWLGGPIPNTELNSSDRKLFDSTVVDIWRAFEYSTRRETRSSTPVDSSLTFRALETKDIRVVLAPPAFTYDEIIRPVKMGSNSDAGFVVFSVPLGIQIAETQKDASHAGQANMHSNQLNNPSGGIQSSRTAQMTIPLITVLCDDAELVHVRDLLLVSGGKSKIDDSSNFTNDGSAMVQDDRQTHIARIGEARIGYVDSSLEIWGCFCRTACVFSLLLRSVGLELRSWNAARKDHLDFNCNNAFSFGLAELIQRPADSVREALAEATSFVQSGTEKSQGASNRETAQFPFHLAPLDDSAPIALKSVSQSIDVSMRTFSLTISGQEIIAGNVIVGKGGITSGASIDSCVPEGIIFNLQFGTICLSIRDDIAANTLQMVSEVASFVREAALTLPSLSYEDHPNGEGEHRTGISVSRGTGKADLCLETTSLSSEGTKFLRKRDIDGLALASRPRAETRNSRQSHLRRSTSSRLRQLYRHTFVNKTDMAVTGTRVQSSLFHPWNSKNMISPQVDTPQRAPQQILFDPGPEQSEAADEDAKRHSAELVNQDLSGDTIEDTKVVLDSTGLGRKSSEVAREDTRSVDGPEDILYACVAVRTAGDSGPPRKRSKSMVRISPVLPPAFSKPVERTPSVHDKSTLRTPFSESGKPRETQSKNVKIMEETEKNQSTRYKQHRSSAVHWKPRRIAKKHQVTMFVSCDEIKWQYFRGMEVHAKTPEAKLVRSPHILLLIHSPKLSFMTSPRVGSDSLVLTASSAEVECSNDPSCTLNGSISQMAVTVSVAQGYASSRLPKLFTSGRLSNFNAKLNATDLQSVLKFREEFKQDMKAVLAAFVISRSSVLEMARSTSLSSAKLSQPARTAFSTMAFDLVCEQSMIKLGGFHPKDPQMTISYTLDGMFLSVVASEDDKAALTLGLRLYGHGLALAAPAWGSNEFLQFPSLDARGVQWGESTGLPTVLKVTAEPLINSTSIQGLRHVIFTVAGLMAFQNVSPEYSEEWSETEKQPTMSTSLNFSGSIEAAGQPIYTQGSTPFSRSVTAWERTKRARMDISIRPMSLSLVSGQVALVFDVETITGIFEWNKLVTAGVQLHTAVNVPKISLAFMRMPSTDFSFSDIRPNEQRTSLSVALEQARIDILKTQDDLTHTFTFRIDVFAVSGQLRPWRLLFDAAVWADEQEFVAELQAINYGSLARQRQVRPSTEKAQGSLLEHRIILVGANVQRFILAIPLVNSERYSSSRLAVRATELHLLVRQRFDSLHIPGMHVMEIKSNFLGVLWENSSLLSSHHARIVVGLKRPSGEGNSLFGPTKVFVVPGTWRICPRKDVVIAILEAKNGKDNKHISQKTRELLSSLPDMTSRPGSSVAGDSASMATEQQRRLLVESLHLKISRTSGFIEGLEADSPSVGTTDRDGVLKLQEVTRMSKVSVPAFSAGYVRLTDNNFDLVDVDFSEREGEFPRRCLQKVASLFTDLFGAVASDQEQMSSEMQIRTPEQSREKTRDISVLVRFGRSLYRAQENISAEVEACFGFFAGKSSAILASLVTTPVFDDEVGHTTVVTGISPKLALEITPVIDGAKIQSIRLTDARFFHGMSPCYAPHTLLSLNKVTALIEAKTLLLTESHLRLRENPQHGASVTGQILTMKGSVAGAERNVLLVFGNRRNKPANGERESRGREIRVEPDIRLQVKLSQKDQSEGEQVDLFVERMNIGFSRSFGSAQCAKHPFEVQVSLYDVMLRGQWEILGCKLRLREDLMWFNSLNVSKKNSGHVVFANIANRLQIECLQYGKNTLKLDVDALASMCSVPDYSVRIESTIIHSEVSHTMRKAITKLVGQTKKLQNEVRLLTERDLPKETRKDDIGKNNSFDNKTFESVVDATEAASATEESMFEGENEGDGQSLVSLRNALLLDGRLWRPSTRTCVSVTGDGLVLMMRGYQFDEARHSALVALSHFDLKYRYDFACGKISNTYTKDLKLNFSEMKLSYNDEERGIHSDLFKVPSPNLSLNIADNEKTVSVELLGDLEVKLGHGFYYWKEFRKLFELTVHGIAPSAASETDQSAQSVEESALWDGRPANVVVRLHPRIDVIGDLTTDMLPMMAARLGRVDIIPKQMHDNVLIPIEALSKALCAPLSKQLNSNRIT